MLVYNVVKLGFCLARMRLNIRILIWSNKGKVLITCNKGGFGTNRIIMTKPGVHVHNKMVHSFNKWK